MISLVIIGVSFLIALSFHEFAHAWAANKLGDPNPKLAGRLTLNPLTHLDPIGTIVLPLFLIFSRSPIIFGWAKPVMIDIFNLKNPRRDMGLISLAGPGANIFLAVILAVLLRIFNFPLNFASPLVIPFVLSLITINISLAVFNLLPFHPLDGGKILVGFLPSVPALKVESFLSQYGQILLLLSVFPFFGRSLISFFLSPIISFLLSLLIPSIPLV